MKTGILGLPGSGKTTLFGFLAGEKGALDPAHPPNKPRARTVRVHDPRLDRLRDDYRPKKFTPATLELLDFPAMPKGEADRAGLADLLAPAREVDALILVVRDFTSPSVPGGDVASPLEDLQEVLAELVLSDISIAERRLEKLGEKSRKPHFSDDDRKEVALLEQVLERLEREDRSVFDDLGAEGRKRMGGFGFLSSKPFVTVLNAERGEAQEPRMEPIRNAAGGEVLVVAARNEVEILELPEEDRATFLQEYGIRESMREPLIRAIYRAAGRITFFTVCDKEVHAWTILAGDTAPRAAGAVHTDFEKGFIRAEVVSHEDYVRYGGMKGAREKGHYRLEGREYVVQDGDIIEFRFSV